MFVCFENAEQLVNVLDLRENKRFYALLHGNFIFGDIFEALICKAKDYSQVKKLTISTLSYSQENVDSFANLLNFGLINELNIITSDYFFGHEIRGLVPYTYEKLDIDNKFQFAVCQTHAKIGQFEFENGRKIVIHGSANLRSSNNIEQICIEENADLYDFNQKWFDEVLKEYSTIKKSILMKKLWQKVVKAEVM